MPESRPSVIVRRGRIMQSFPAGPCIGVMANLYVEARNQQTIIYGVAEQDLWKAPRRYSGALVHINRQSTGSAYEESGVVVV